MHTLSYSWRRRNIPIISEPRGNGRGEFRCGEEMEMCHPYSGSGCSNQHLNSLLFTFMHTLYPDFFEDDIVTGDET
jgi:hypothetical protein